MDIQTTIDSLEVWEDVDTKIKRLKARVSALEEENAELRSQVKAFKYNAKSDDFIKSLTAGYEEK